MPAEPVTDQFLSGADRMEAIIKKARETGLDLYDSGVRMNQLRNFYEAVVQLGLEADEARRKLPSGVKTVTNPVLVDRARLLHTKLLWSAAKAENQRAKQSFTTLANNVEMMIKGAIETDGQLVIEPFNRFRQFVETIVIYHKAKESRVL